MTDYAHLQDRIQAESFNLDSYNSTLCALIKHTLETESPIAEDLLVKRIARAHGFKRASRLIRERILDLVDQDFQLRADPVEGSFVWLNEGAPPIPVRRPTSGDSTRRIEEIPSDELAAARSLVEGDDPALKIARHFGILRLSSSARERIEQAITKTA